MDARRLDVPRRCDPPGSKWAYEEVGWGGWYAWDPVENAALMPWLVATAFLHSVMIQEKKNMLRVWNSVLIALAFGLSIFGTFLTRSGVLNSIHSFTESSIGPWFIGFLALVAAGSAALIIWRLPLLRSRTKLESLVSREAAFLYNNLFLVALALTVLWGVVYPAGLGGDPRRGGHGWSALLQFLCGRLRAPGHPADGPRAAGRLAAGVASLARGPARMAGRRRARGRNHPRSWPGPDRAQQASSATRSRPLR